MKTLPRLALLCFLASPHAALAQVNDAAADAHRMERLERDIMLIQRQLARGDAKPFNGNENSDEVFSQAPTAGDTADTGVRLMQLEEEMRTLHGKLEEAEFKNRQLEEKLERMQKDVDYRFDEVNMNAPKADAPQEDERPTRPTPKRHSETPTSLAPAITTEEPVEQAGDDSKLHKIIEKSAPKKAAAPEPEDDSLDEEEDTGNTSPSGPTSAGDGVLKAPGEETSGPREHYNHAFKLLNQTKYDEAADEFRGFISNYPKDPLIGNAYYWLGETFYISRDYIQAADTFRQGFEALPNGPKAADNLLKLSMSLSAMQKEKEACIVLDQILAKFDKTSAAVTDKARKERARLGCS